MAYDAHNFQFRYELLNGRIREKDGQTMRSVHIPSDTPVIVKEACDILSLIQQKKSFLLCLGFTDCPWCRVLIEPLCRVATFREEPFYYCDIKSIRDIWELEDGIPTMMKAGSPDYIELLAVLDPVLEEWYLSDETYTHIDTGIKHIFSPSVIAIKDGTPVALDSCTSDLMQTGYDPLSDKMVQEMHKKINHLFDLVSDHD